MAEIIRRVATWWLYASPSWAVRSREWARSIVMRCYARDGAAVWRRS